MYLVLIYRMWFSVSPSRYPVQTWGLGRPMLTIQIKTQVPRWTEYNQQVVLEPEPTAHHSCATGRKRREVSLRSQIWPSLCALYNPGEGRIPWPAWNPKELESAVLVSEYFLHGIHKSSPSTRPMRAAGSPAAWDATWMSLWVLPPSCQGHDCCFSWATAIMPGPAPQDLQDSKKPKPVTFWEVRRLFVLVTKLPQ